MKAWFLKKLRMAYLKHKKFYGSYADNLIEIKKFISENNIIVVYFTSDALKVPMMVEDDTAINDVVIAEQKRLYRREFRKEKKATLFYVENDFFAKILGYKVTKYHIQLAA